jgi:hypothetical protein
MPRSTLTILAICTVQAIATACAPVQEGPSQGSAAPAPAAMSLTSGTTATATGPTPAFLSANSLCLSLSGPHVDVPGSTTYTVWCDPNNNDVLQADTYQKLPGGDPGYYAISYVGFSCTNNSSSIPATVRNQLC